MYTPIDDKTTIDAKIHHFIESKSSRSAWGTIKNTITQWRTSTVESGKPAKDDIAYETIDWSHSSFGRSRYGRLAH